ncbi:unnamed protein product, partial [Porites lobata]
VLLASLFWSVIMKRSLIPLISMGAIFLVLVGACLVILLQKDRSSKDTTSENTVMLSRRPVKYEQHEEQDFPVDVGSLNRPEASRNSTHKEHYRRFCRTCCQTPPCWYKNHKECGKCADQSKTRQGVSSRLLRKSFKKAARHHRREQIRMQENNLMH